jgi:kynurenine formamidase
MTTTEAITTRRTPAFAELPALPDRDERHAWDVWGREDELGTLNLIGPAERIAAAALVRTGRTVSLNLPLDEPNPGLFPGRPTYTHVVEDLHGGHDDRLDGFFPQGSSQWDGLRHIRAGQHGYWGGRQEADLVETDVLGIDRWARAGVVGRGVLVDVAAHLERQGTPLVPDSAFAITPDLLEEVAAAQGTAFRSGDVLIVRTGWTQWYRALPQERRAALLGTVGSGFACPGLDGAQATAAWLWDREIAAVACDNVGVEVFPVDRAKGFLHRRLIPLQGMLLGELWLLDELSQVCAEAGRHEFLFFAGLLDLPRGVGSPANAYALL